ncbi:hypothetical protein CHU98_g3380 [Xylaria longipes]|nr:hypothetical protein CHU98_g3380 [Xylaria longipes]
MGELLTAEAAQRLIQEAVQQQGNRQTRDMAALLAAQTAQNNQNMAQLLAAAQPNGSTTSLRSSDVGYFDPSAKDPTFAGLVADGKTTKYTDVYAFTDRLKHLSTQQSEAEVRKLIERFKPSWSTAMGRLQSYQFTLHDIDKGQDILGFVQRVIRDAKGCNQDDTNQLKADFEAFDGDIQSQLTVPTETTTVDAFLTQIREREGEPTAEATLPKTRDIFRTGDRTRETRGCRELPRAPLTGIPGITSYKALIPPERRLPAPPPKPPAWQQNKPQQKAYHGDDYPSEEYQEEPPPFGYEDFAQFEDEDHPEQPQEAPSPDYQPPSVEPAEDCGFATVYHGSYEPQKHRCRDCNEEFPSKNKLHDHLRKRHGKLRDRCRHLQAEWDTVQDAQHGSLGDKHWIKDNFPNVEWRKRATPVTLRGIGASLHTTDDYVMLPMYFQGTDSTGRPAIAHFVREIALVDDLRANALIGTDILQPEEFDILMSQHSAIINSCNVAIPMNTTRKGKAQKTLVRSSETQTVKPYSYMTIPVYHAAEDQGDDLLFEPAESRLSQVVGHLMTMYPDCIAYQVEKDKAATAAEFAIRRPARPRDTRNSFTHDPAQRVKHRTGVNIYNDPAIVAAVSPLLDEFELVFQDTGFADIPEEEWMKVTLKDDWQKDIPKHCLHKGHKLYRTKNQVPFSFPVFVIWKTIRQPDGLSKRKGRMVVDIRPGNRIFLRDAYPVRTQGEILNHIAGKPLKTILDAIAFYYQWRLHPESQWAFTITTHQGQFTFTCAVMGYMNSNAYVQRQMDFFLHDTTARAYCDDIVVASSTLQDHVQDLRKVFTIFRDRNISMGPSKSYIAFPNTVVLGRLVNSLGMTTTEEKLEAIQRLKFPQTLRDLEVFIGLTTWLRNSVPRYGILVKPLQDRKTNLKRARSGSQSKTARKNWTTTVEFTHPTEAKAQAFTQIKNSLLDNISLAFCSPVRQLFADFDSSADGIGIEVYHVREDVIPRLMQDSVIAQYPPRYAIQTIACLSRPLTEAEKRHWPTEMELCGFVWLLKKCKQWLNTAKMTPIVFTDCKATLGLCNRNTNIASSTASSNSNRKIVHALEYISQFKLRIIHKSGKSHIVPDALSRLPREDSPSDPNPQDPGGLDELPDDREEHWAMHWIHQAENIPEPTQGIPSQARLPPMRTQPQDSDTFDVNIPLGGHTQDSIPLIQMDPDFKAQLQRGYLKDPHFQKILTTLKAQARLKPDDQAKLPFYLRDGVLWNKSETLADRLCIPRSCIAALWEAMHRPSHISYGKLVQLLQLFCIHRVLKRLKEYTDGCPDYRILQPRHHKPYGSLQPILSPPCPYYQITIDFMLALPTSKKNNYNAAMLAVCKLTKQIQLIPGQKDWTAEQWGQAFISRLLITSWGIPRVIISDRDPKFLSALWKTVWKKLQTKLLYTTAYHPQADGQSEIAVQTAQSALRYYVNSLDDPAEWEDSLPRLQFEYNNSRNSTTGKTANELAFGFTPAPLPTLLGYSHTI